jgi:hypothetical protein
MPPEPSRYCGSVQLFPVREIRSLRSAGVGNELLRDAVHLGLAGGENALQLRVGRDLARFAVPLA